jgi:hypothetical protein
VRLETQSGKTNIADFATPGKAIYRYTAGKPKGSPEPSISEIENPTTGKAEGVVNLEAKVTIRGQNFVDVQHVTFGDVEAQVVQSTPKVLIVRVPAVAEEKGVQVVIVAVGKDGQTLKNLADFQVPGKATYKFIAKRQPPEPSTRRGPRTRQSRSRDQASPKAE